MMAAASSLSPRLTPRLTTPKPFSESFWSRSTGTRCEHSARWTDRGRIASIWRSFLHCERLGYPNDPLRLFQFLQNEECKKYLSLEEIDPDAAECLARGDM